MAFPLSISSMLAHDSPAQYQLVTSQCQLSRDGSQSQLSHDLLVSVISFSSSFSFFQGILHKLKSSTNLFGCGATSQVIRRDLLKGESRTNSVHVASGTSVHTNLPRHFGFPKREWN